MLSKFCLLFVRVKNCAKVLRMHDDDADDLEQKTKFAFSHILLLRPPFALPSLFCRPQVMKTFQKELFLYNSRQDSPSQFSFVAFYYKVGIA